MSQKGKEVIMGTLKFDDDLKPVIVQDEETPTASMERQAMLGGFDSFRFGNIEVGKALVGGTVASLMSETVDGLVPGGGLLGAVAKLATASFVLPVFKGIVGASGVSQAQTFIAYDVVRQILPLDNLIRQATGGIFGGSQLQYAPNRTTEYGGQAGAMFGENGSLANWASVVGGGS